MKAIHFPSGDQPASRSWMPQLLVRLRVGPCCGDGTRAFDECVTAGVGVGVDKDQLPGSLLESREKGVGFGIGIAQDGHGMPCSEDDGRREFDVEALFERGT